MPPVIIYSCAAMLFIGAAPLPYGYYTLLRLVACGVFAFAAFVAFAKAASHLAWLYVLLALVFNPIIKVYLSKGSWTLIDLGAGLLLVVTARFLTVENSPPPNDG